MDSFPDSSLLTNLSDLIIIKGFGIECRGCMTSEGLKFGDEDFFGCGCVKITISPPASINEAIIIVTNQVFYNALRKRIESYIKNNPQDKEITTQYMEIIKNNLSAN